MEHRDLLIQTAKNMVKKGKGILAADESNPTCGKRFDSIGVDSTFENRNEYRDMLLSSDGIENYISGVIMFDETFRQSTTCSNKTPFTKFVLYLIKDKSLLSSLSNLIRIKFNFFRFLGDIYTIGY